MTLYVDNGLLPPVHFIDPATDVEDPDAYFVIRRELPHKYQMEYLDLAVGYEIDLDDEDEETVKVKATANKMLVSQVTDILMEGGLVTIAGVFDAETKQPITAADWKKLPGSLMSQITKAIQKTAKGKKTDSKN
jgi:hypothetical protein